MHRTPTTQSRGRPSAPSASPERPLPAVLLVMPHALDRAPLAQLLATRNDLALAGEASDATSLRAPPRRAPTVILVALTLVGLRDGIGVAEVLRRYPGVPIVALAPHEEDECLALVHPTPSAAPGLEAEDAVLPDLDCLTLAVLQGARGALRRSATPDELVRALIEVAHGGFWYDESLSRRIMAWARLSTHGDMGSFLNPRESLVAAGLAAGQANKEIAGAIGVSETTVKRHVGHLLHRFQLADRLQLGLLLSRHGYLFDRAEPRRTRRRGPVGPRGPSRHPAG